VVQRAVDRAPLVVLVVEARVVVPVARARVDEDGEVERGGRAERRRLARVARVVPHDVDDVDRRGRRAHDAGVERRRRRRERPYLAARRDHFSDATPERA